MSALTYSLVPWWLACNIFCQVLPLRGGYSEVTDTLVLSHADALQPLVLHFLGERENVVHGTT